MKETIKMAIASTKQMLKYYLSPSNKLGIIMNHFCWDEEDFCQEFLNHLLYHNKSSTISWREKWLVDGIVWDLETIKIFKGWTKVEMKAFIGRLYYREIMRKAEVDVIIEPAKESYEIEETIMNKQRLDNISKYVESATEREKFIYSYQLGLTNLSVIDGRIQNYPDGSVTQKTFYVHVAKFLETLKCLGEKYE
jgi:hypothetical protein